MLGRKEVNSIRESNGEREERIRLRTGYGLAPEGEWRLSWNFIKAWLELAKGQVNIISLLASQPQKLSSLGWEDIGPFKEPKKEGQAAHLTAAWEEVATKWETTEDA